MSLLRLLLVEDSENDALLIVNAIEQAGYDVECERVDKSDAMLAALTNGAWDVIISDYNIPRFGAKLALQLLHDYDIDIPFIVVSGVMGEETAVEIMRAGANDYVMKENLTRLIPAIEREIKDAQIRAERRQAEQLVLRLGRILDNSPSEIYVCDAQSLQFVQVNKGALQNTGYTWDELSQRRFYDLPLDLKQPDLMRYIESLSREDTVTFEMTMQRIDGSTYPAEVHLSLSPAEKPPMCMAIVQDITERKRAEAELRSFTEHLERANKELEYFAYIASHDLQEPLRKVSLFSSRIERKYASVLDDDGKNYIRRMQNSVQRMQTFIQDLLKYSRLSGTDKNAYQSVDVAHVTRNVVDDLEHIIKATRGRIDIDSLPVIQGNPVQIYQLFQNLCSNALKYHREGVPPHVSIRCEENDKYYQIVVEDNGIGFSNNHKDRIFGFFQRLHANDEYEGSGIGLAICRKIMDNHDGFIDAEGWEGKGARFVVAFPRTD